MLVEGSIILVDFLQSDGAVKKRPAVIVRRLPPFGDLLLAGISTQLHQAIAGFDLILQQNDPDFHRTGLRATSVVRIALLARYAANDPRINGELGKLAAADLALAQQRLAKLILEGA